jgi:two-component system chemotaxis response regulator CheB
MRADGSGPVAPIRVLVADDSAVARLLLLEVLGEDPALQVVATVPDGQAAIEYVQQHAVDVVLMDLHMPRVDGFEATRRIMETTPLPIVVCSAGSNVRDQSIAFRALEVGAIACVEKPLALAAPEFRAVADHLRETLRLMAEVKVVRRRPAFAVEARAAGGPNGAPAAQGLRLVGIGASTGGPPVLQAILAGLPRGFPVPLLVVQHIAPGFLAGMAAWLAETTGHQVVVASHGAVPQPAHTYLAPDDFHMGVAAEGHIVLSRTAPENHVRPAVSFLFRSLAQHCAPHCAGVLLSGMGRDGAQELRLLRDRGAVTIAQDEASCVVHGMPGAAIALGGAARVLAAERIAPALASLAGAPHR